MERTCTKCDREMIAADGLYALPLYVERDARGADGSQINPKTVLPFQVFRCNDCGRIELVEA